eukprot:TRINITY_DN12685_c0_g1_i1.p1 TRINITY_DN12685_c0_g1~~TRINITY_DN12685_c0_g1_i1.p1  ORF type:complete len:658 (+),score=48.90 TRINITY_DN12685_c0_g1_i1:352-2325(+)
MKSLKQMLSLRHQRRKRCRPIPYAAFGFLSTLCRVAECFAPSIRDSPSATSSFLHQLQQDLTVSGYQAASVDFDASALQPNVSPESKDVSITSSEGQGLSRGCGSAVWEKKNVSGRRASHRSRRQRGRRTQQVRTDGKASKQQILELMDVWNFMYNLTESEPPSPRVTAPSGWGLNELERFPYAPHLQDCGRLHKVWTQQETRGENGADPPWLLHRLPARADLQPPWIEGSDRDNLGGTRYIQAMMWKRQFPPDCSDPSLKFLVYDWSSQHEHGIGSQIHMMSQVFAFAMEYDRIFVPSPGSYQNAQHDDCQGDKWGSLDCYFFPIVHPACSKRVDEWVKANYAEIKGFMQQEILDSVLSNRPIVYVKAFLPQAHILNFYLPRELEHLWNTSEKSVEVLGGVPDFTTVRENTHGLYTTLESSKAGWWRSQTTRYFLRRPQPYLCHHVNKVRQSVFGHQMASLMAQIPSAMRKIEERSGDLRQSERTRLEAMSGMEGSLDDSPLWREGPPLLPRPIVSMHVRQGDKQREMQTFSFAAHMWLAERLRRRYPLVSNLWLSTQEQDVIDDSAHFTTWDFFFEHHEGRTSMRANKTRNHYWAESEFGLARTMISSFVDILISSECDYFIGSLGSNWSRLLNELRQTGGRLKAGFLAINFLEY